MDTQAEIVIDDRRAARSDTVTRARSVAASLPPPRPGSLRPPVLFAREGALANLAAAREEALKLVRTIAAVVVV
jgi:hypothetical protein